MLLRTENKVDDFTVDNTGLGQSVSVIPCSSRSKMPKATIVVPAFCVESTLAETLEALLAQTFTDFEIVIVDDGSRDSTAEIARSFCSDPRIRLVSQPNRGLAGARNTGIALAQGEYIGFCDADDIWEAGKLAAHVAHLDQNPFVGLSFSGSALIDDAGNMTGQAQRPRLRNIKASHIFKRNPVGNGSAAVMRREALNSIGYRRASEINRTWYFDETFRQSEDIECWLRLALTTDWEIEGVSGLLTRYRINSGGLSAGTDRQLAAWERMVEKLTPLEPAFFAKLTPLARAYQLRYLGRRAISEFEADRAVDLVRRSIASSARPFLEEPVKSTTTLAAAYVLALFGGRVLRVARFAVSRSAEKFRKI